MLSAWRIDSAAREDEDRTGERYRNRATYRPPGTVVDYARDP
jgi:hypothetical protein